MLPIAINYDYHAARTDPGVKGIYAAANHPANKTVFQHFIEKHSSEQNAEKATMQGINVPFSCSLTEIMMKNKPEEVITPEKEMLSKLRSMFSIPVIVIGSEEDDMPHRIKLGLGNGDTFRKFRITEEILRRMSEDPEIFQNITEKMQRYYNGTCEFIQNFNGVITSMEMYISENGIVYAATENYDAPEEMVKKAKATLNDLHDFFLKWLEKRDNPLKDEEIHEEEASENSSEYLIENVFSK
ncbi:MAG: hypothetical protein FWD44_01090 [Oscillospiraceae bacterium]|nr:hypothetical protein [Oscillospiraceae bacterium]